MLITLGIGIVIGIVIVITALKMTMHAEPTGCIIFFGLLISTLLGFITIMLKSMIVG